jgi:hypothetical protein
MSSVDPFKDLWRQHDGPPKLVRCTHCKYDKKSDGFMMCEECRELNAAFQRRKNLRLKDVRAQRRAELEAELKALD